MVVEAILTAAFGLTFGGLAYYSWRQRELARQEMERSRELAEIGASVDALAHDLENLLMAIALALPRDDKVDEVDVGDLCGDIERGLGSATKMVRAIRARQGSRAGAHPAADEEGSVEGLVRLVAALLRRKGARIKLDVAGDFAFRGPQVEAIRVVHNLVFNAQHEAEAIDGGYVRIELDDHELRIANPVRDPDQLDKKVYATGVSGRRSSGLGLSTAVASARALGWSVSHRVTDDPGGSPTVVFRVRPGPPPEGSTASRPEPPAPPG